MTWQGVLVAVVITAAALFVRNVIERRRRARAAAAKVGPRPAPVQCGAGIYRDLYRVGSCVLPVGHDGPCRPPCFHNV
jgi:hypothetical protein